MPIAQTFLKAYVFIASCTSCICRGQCLQLWKQRLLKQSYSLASQLIFESCPLWLEPGYLKAHERRKAGLEVAIFKRCPPKNNRHITLCHPMISLSSPDWVMLDDLWQTDCCKPISSKIYEEAANFPVRFLFIGRNSLHPWRLFAYNRQKQTICIGILYWHKVWFKQSCLVALPDCVFNQGALISAGKTCHEMFHSPQFWNSPLSTTMVAVQLLIDWHLWNLCKLFLGHPFSGMLNIVFGKDTPSVTAYSAQKVFRPNLKRIIWHGTDTASET